MYWGINMIKIHYNKETGEVIQAYDSAITIDVEPIIIVEDSEWNASQPFPCIKEDKLCVDTDKLNKRNVDRDALILQEEINAELDAILRSIAIEKYIAKQKMK